MQSSRKCIKIMNTNGRWMECVINKITAHYYPGSTKAQDTRKKIL